MNEVIQGDCLEVMKGLADNSVDALVTDPPAGIAFMGKSWDSDKGGRRQWCSYMEERFAEALRVCKPGAYGLVWALPRTSHWTATALEDAGWEVRDCIVHLFGSGFPKSHDIGKAIDKMKGCDREILGTAADFARDGSKRKTDGSHKSPTNQVANGDRWSQPVTAPSSPEAKQWDGWGTALKPANEHWILVRKPIEGAIAANVLERGTGGINIGGCRVGDEKRSNQPSGTPGVGRLRNCNLVDRGDGKAPDGRDLATSLKYIEKSKTRPPTEVLGRFPANSVLSHSPDCDDSECVDGCAVRALNEQSGILKSGAKLPHHIRTTSKTRNAYGERVAPPKSYPSSEGGASRYFPTFHYYPKASASDRSHNGQVQNNHPTVKNRELMRWLCRLVTPPGGLVLDPFGGSGSTAIACIEEQFKFLLIEQDTESVETARARVDVARGALGQTQEFISASQRVEWLESQVKPKQSSSGLMQLSMFDMVNS
jgi:DNA modification methylase